MCTWSRRPAPPSAASGQPDCGEEHRHHRHRHGRRAHLELQRRRFGRRVPGRWADQGRELHHHPRRPERQPHQRQIDVTITGTNDAPVIGVQDLVGAITEAVTPVGNLTDSGTIAFSDVDLNDVHLVSPTGTAIGSVLGSLTATKNTDTTGSGTGGQLSWNYSVAASAVEYLAAGQTKVESFTITLDDQNGSVTTRQIDVTITGTNDAPVIGVRGPRRRRDRTGHAGRQPDRQRHDCLQRRRPERCAPRLADRHRHRQRPGQLDRRQERRHHQQRHRRPADLDLQRRRVGRRVPGRRPDQGRELHDHARRPERQRPQPPDRRHHHRHQ